ARLAETAPPVAALSTLKQANLAIETDSELRDKFTSDADTLSYIASLAAAATAIYERDVSVRLNVSYVRLWGDSPPDPCPPPGPLTATDTSGALTELRDYWNAPANNMNTIAGPHTVVHLVSGKIVSGGIAYIDVLCSPSFAYGVSQVNGTFNLADPSQIWDV